MMSLFVIAIIYLLSGAQEIHSHLTNDTSVSQNAKDSSRTHHFTSATTALKSIIESVKALGKHIGALYKGKGLILEPSKVAFSAYRTSPFAANGASRTISYSGVRVNIGNGMDPKTGVFKVPISGIYQFSFNFLILKAKHAWVELYHGSNVLSATGWSSGATSYLMAGNNVILNLAVNDKVWLELRANGNIYDKLNELYTTFNGHML